jgi:chitin synthase
MNVYAFCNIHDFTWGTKGEDKAAKLDSPTVTSDGNVDVVLPFDDSDLDALYDSELQKFSTLDTKEKSTTSTSDEQEDYYKGFRSYVVLIWMFCNAALVAIVLKAGGLNRLSVQQQPSNQGDPSATVQVYLQVVLWSVACLSGFKFVGAMWYLIIGFVSNWIQHLY